MLESNMDSLGGFFKPVNRLYSPVGAGGARPVAVSGRFPAEMGSIDTAGEPRVKSALEFGFKRFASPLS
jgi:hypothetical protein